MREFMFPKREGCIMLSPLVLDTCRETGLGECALTEVKVWEKVEDVWQLAMWTLESALFAKERWNGECIPGRSVSASCTYT